MPITVYPAAYSGRVLQENLLPVSSGEDLLKEACPDEWRLCKEVYQSSFDASPLEGLYASQNGFISTCILAYNHHHHLHIRPEDVWFTILNQLSFYINAHAEELRQFFVSHQGKEELEVLEFGNRYSVDFGRLAIKMTQLMEKKVKDPDLRSWVMPDFTTTTNTDLVTAAVLFMGSMQKYFSFRFTLMCGLPSATLAGERADWEKIRSKVDKIDRLGEEPAKFAALLRIVLDFFLRTFDEPQHPDVVDFWSRIAHETNHGSGSTLLSGWITAFCFWNAEGEPLAEAPKQFVFTSRRSRSLTDFYGRMSQDVESYTKHEPSKDSGALSNRLNLDLFHTLDNSDIPNGYSSVPVLVDDNRVLYNTRMVAGSVGIQAWSSGMTIDTSTGHRRADHHIEGSRVEWIPDSIEQPQVGERTGIDSVQPVSGWWIYELPKDTDADETEIEKLKRELGLSTPKEIAMFEESKA